MAETLYAYGSYYPPIQQQNLSSGRDYGEVREAVEPGEVFDLLLRKECEKNSRRIHTPQHTMGFNQFNFMRAGTTLAIVASQLTLNPQFSITPSPSVEQGNEPEMPAVGVDQAEMPAEFSLKGI